MFALPSGDGIGGEIIVRSRHSGGRRSAGADRPSAATTRAEFKSINYELPLSISKRFRDVQFKTLVGLSSLGGCAWYSVDDTVFLWRFRDNAETTIQCDGVVTAVAIGVPAPFVFSSTVRLIVAVATENSVSLYGLDAGMKHMQLEGYFLPLAQAGVTVFSQAAVTVTGRVLLWTSSDPTSVTEVRYSPTASWFKAKIYYHFHSLLRTSGSPGLVSAVLGKLGSIFAPPKVAKGTGSDAVRVYVHADSTFMYFVSVDASCVSLHEISPAPSPHAVSTASWRHEADADITIRCIARQAITDLVGTGRIVSASVTVCVDSGEPLVNVVTDQAELVVAKPTNGQLVIVRSKSQAIAATTTDLVKRQKTSFGGLSLSGASLCSVGIETGGVCVTGQGTQVVVNGVSDYEVNGSVLALAVERSVESDAFSSFVLPVLTSGSDELLAPRASSDSVLVLTGKGVTVLEPVPISVATTGGTVPVPVTPKTVAEVVQILSAPSSVTFAYKPMFVRAISDDIAVASLQEERDFCSRHHAPLPMAGGVWIGGVVKIADSLVSVLTNERVLTSNGRIAASQLVLESVATRARDLVKFVRQVLAAAGPAGATHIVPVEAGNSAYKRRMYLHSTLKETAVKQQAIRTLERTVDDLAASGEVIGFLAVVAEYRSSAFTNIDVGGWTISDLVASRSSTSTLKQLCENLIIANQDEMQAIVTKLKLVAPSILCRVSPGVVPFSAEGVAAMLQCALAHRSPVHVLLDAVKTLARSNAQISRTLTEVISIVRALDDAESKKLVVVATLDGLQERLMDEAVVHTVLAWASGSLSGELNEFVLDHLVARGYAQHVTGSANAYIEQFLLARIESGKKVFVEMYAAILERTGRAQLAGQVLERAAFSTTTSWDVAARLELLTLANKVYPTQARFDLAMVAKYVQMNLLRRLENEEILSQQLLSVSDLHAIAKSNDVHEVVLLCYLFVSVKEAETVRAWSNVLFSDLSFFVRNSDRFFAAPLPGVRGVSSVAAGIVRFVDELYAISKEVDSFTIWSKPELIAAMIEYLNCLLEARIAVPAMLESTLKLSPQQTVEVYVKIVRELNVWLAAIPRVRGELTPPTVESVRTHLVDTVVAFAQRKQHEISQNKLVSLLILVKNYLKSDHDELENLIHSLTKQNADKQTVASLPGL